MIFILSAPSTQFGTVTVVVLPLTLTDTPYSLYDVVNTLPILVAQWLFDPKVTEILTHLLLLSTASI